MDEATQIAELVRRDLKALQSRTAAVDLAAAACCRCGRLLLAAPPQPPPGAGLPGGQGGALPPFYLFPSGQAYHALCCAAEVIDLVAPQQQVKIRSLVSQLVKAKPYPQATAGGGGGGGMLSAAGGVLMPAAAAAQAAVGGVQGQQQAGPQAAAPQQTPQQQQAEAAAAAAKEASAALRALQAQLAEEVAAEDPRNGEVTLLMIDRPFVTEKDLRAEADSWRI